MTIDCVIRNGKIVSSSGLVQASICIDDGRIVAICNDALIPKAEETIDADGKVILPGAIDCHVHFRDPGQTDLEDFETGSKAAIAGGVTTVLDMPNTNPIVVKSKIFKEKLEEIGRKAIVDYALYASAGALRESPHELHRLADAGAIAFKMLMTYSGVTPLQWVFLKDNQILEAFEAIARTGLPTVVHAESHDLVEYFTQRIRNLGRKDPEAHSDSRPDLVEAEAVARAILLAGHSGVQLHIAHMSTAEGVEYVRSAKRRGQNVSCETCPHYLLLSRSDYATIGPLLKMNPPIRDHRHSEALWRGISEGVIDIVSTDHSPHHPEEKESGWQDIWQAKPGFAGVETLMPLMLTEVNRGKITLFKLMEVSSAKPARIFRLPRKGRLGIGYDADLVIVDLKREGVIRAEDLHSKGKATPFDRFKLKGLPTLTMIRGCVVMRDGVVLGKPGSGRLIAPDLGEPAKPV